MVISHREHARCGLREKCAAQAVDNRTWPEVPANRALALMPQLSLIELLV